METDDAAASLAALDGDRAALADRVRQPGWYLVVAGVLIGVAVLSSRWTTAYQRDLWSGR